MNAACLFATKGSLVRYIDISPQIEAGTAVWPGDQGFQRDPRWNLSSGDSVSVSTVTITTHIGAHIDAPSHVREGAPSVESTPIDACLGKCLVVDVSGLLERGSQPHGYAPAAEVWTRIAKLSEQDLECGPIERLLLRHRAAPMTVWDPQTPGIDPELVRWFGEQGGRLLGLDLASFDPERSTELPAHHAAIDAGVVMLEGLDLSHAEEGIAQLTALPIPWRGADAAPVRAVLGYAD
ncbi:arylformamidase [Leucobacter viscericola]|uniref:Arylformamidase n=1 Tax=Leucobacter viscericola TaxID=2714935 RepID=A0A6G7XDH4_9MICO|nr:cyclase family protein [Leucobacter viscericola]QIK62644.1 arylformamidase [Leucobacter viscericola]